jgi:hypothetical protein
MTDVEQAQAKAQEVAGEAQEKAKEAAAKAEEGIRGQIDQRSTQAGERVSATAQDLRSVSEELRKQGKEAPAKLADRAADRTERVGSYLTDNGSDQILRDVEDFGRQRPWAVLAGGLLLGAAAARFLRASARGRYQDRAVSRPQAPGVESARTPAVPQHPVEPAISSPAPATPAPTAVP